MAVLPIRKFGDPVLRRKAAPVTEVTPELKTLAQNMLDTMYAAPGIGLAAPQVGESIRLIVVDVRESEEDELDPLILFNPLIKDPKGQYFDEEGCLSFPEIYATVSRYQTISVDYVDENGQPQHIQNATDILARCIQHEIDHLEGILFVDKISETDKLLLKSKLKKLKKKTKENG